MGVRLPVAVVTLGVRRWMGVSFAVGVSAGGSAGVEAGTAEEAQIRHPDRQRTQPEHELHDELCVVGEC